MTTDTRPASLVGLDFRPCSLHRGELDERDRAICVAVWEFWDEHGYGPSMRWLEQTTGISLASVHSRLSGWHSDGSLRRGGGLACNGWLIASSNTSQVIDRSLRPGPRFAGVAKTRDGARYPLEWS